MGIMEQCRECDKVTKRCRCPHQHAPARLIVCEDCQKAPASEPAPKPAAEPTQLYLHNVHSPKVRDDEGNFQYVIDSSSSPQEIVAFAAGMDYGVRKHLDLFLEVLRVTMDKYEHAEATSLLAVLEDAKQRERDETAKQVRVERPQS